MSIKEPYVHFSPTAAVPEVDVGFITDIVLLPASDEMTSKFAFEVSIPATHFLA
jgi:hypothetical protein